MPAAGDASPPECRLCLAAPSLPPSPPPPPLPPPLPSLPLLPPPPPLPPPTPTPRREGCDGSPSFLRSGFCCVDSTGPRRRLLVSRRGAPLCAISSVAVTRAGSMPRRLRPRLFRRYCLVRAAEPGKGAGSPSPRRVGLLASLCAARSAVMSLAATVCITGCKSVARR